MLVRVVAVLFAGIAGWWLVALMAAGRVAAAVRVLPPLAAACIVAYALLWRPAVVVDDDGVLLRNVLRDVWVPWARLTSVDTRFALTLLTDDGGRHQSWAASAPGWPSLLRGVRGQPPNLPDPRWLGQQVGDRVISRDLRVHSGVTAFMVEQRWAAWREHGSPGPQPVAVTWNMRTLAALATTVAASVVSLAAINDV